jgi:hypothetical protein
MLWTGERWDPTHENGELGIQLTCAVNHNENGEGICSADKGSNRRIQTNDSFRIRKGGVKTRSRIRGARCRGGVDGKRRKFRTKKKIISLGVGVQGAGWVQGCVALIMP